MKPEGRFPALPILSAFSLSIGCILGWGAFVEPGKVLIPKAGALGSVLGMILASLIALIIVMNYIGLSRVFPGVRSMYHMVMDIFGPDRTFFIIWSLLFGYFVLIWANSSAIAYIGRLLYEDSEMHIFHYNVMGYEVYAADVLLPVLVLFSAAFILNRGTGFALKVITAVSVGLILSVLILSTGVISRADPSALFSPAFSSGPGFARISDVMFVAALAPWLFVGFEAVSPVISELKITHSLAFSFAGVAVIIGAAEYIMLGVMINTTVPEGFRHWEDHAAAAEGIEHFSEFPAFFAVERYMGRPGVALLIFAFFCAVFGSVLGFMLAIAHTVRIAAGDGLIPGTLAEVNENGMAFRPVLLTVLFSLPFLFLGMNVVGWAVNLSAISVSFAYFYVSVGVFLRSDKPWFKVSGIMGALILSAVFFLYIVPGTRESSSMVKEEYAILAVWCLSGLACYRYVLKRDTEQRLGKNFSIWLLMLTLLFHSTNMWTSELAKEELMSSEKRDISFILTTENLIRDIVFAVALILLFELFSILISRSRAMAEKIRDEEEQNRMKNSLLSGMSHDIRTPMNAIIGFTDLALSGEKDPEVMTDYLGKIKVSGTRLLSLIEDVFEMNSIENNDVEFVYEPVNLPEVFKYLQSVSRDSDEARGREVILDMSPMSNKVVIFDRKRLIRIMQSVITGALKNTPEGGCVIFGAMQLSSAENGTAVYEFSVKDSGTGLQEDKDDPYTGTGSQGTGLGRRIATELVRMAGGDFEIETIPGECTEVYITLEMRVLQDDEQEAGVPDRSVLRGRRALVVDDIMINRQIAVAILKSCGMKTEEASNGEEALSRFSEILPGYYDVVLMDVQMPGMNGFDAARGIRSLPDPVNASVPIFAMTANVYDEDGEKAHESGLKGFIAKPIDSDYLVSALVDTFKEA
ncbi:MAG: amino acid permease [Lachnospiraceae bacterium]|nr:amino acid permease [Lachnospiraceae bacterium]